MDFGGATSHRFAMDVDGVHVFVRRDLRIEPGDARFGNPPFGFAEAEAGELHARGSTVSSPAGTGGSGFRIAAP